MIALRLLALSLALLACARPHPAAPVSACTVELYPKTGVTMFAADAAGDVVLLQGEHPLQLTRARAGGAVAWQAAIDQPGHPDAMALDSAGDVLITSWSDRPEGNADLPGCVIGKWSGADGHAIWSTTFTGTGQQMCRGIEADRAGEVYVTGFFAGTLDTPRGPVASRGMSDVLVARLSAKDGTPRWVRQIGGRGDDISRVIVVDHHGDLLVGGNFSQGIAPADGTIELAGTWTSAGDADGFVVKLTATGEPIWARTFGDVGWDIVKSIVVDRDDNLYASGAWMRPQDFHGELPFHTGVMDGFVARYARDGTLAWRKIFGGGGSQAHHLALDDRGRLWVIGHFKGSVVLPGRTLEAAGESAAYLAGFTSAGVLTSAELVGAPAAQYGYGVAATPQGLVLGGTSKGDGRFCGHVHPGSSDGNAFVERRVH